MRMQVRAAILLAAATMSNPVLAAEVTAQQVRDGVSAGGEKADFSGQTLENLDLSGLDLRQANFEGAQMHGVKLDSVNLEGARLKGATLDLAWIMGANLTKADLRDVNLHGPVVAPGLDIDMSKAPTFKGADFSGAQIIARFSQFDLEGAKFVGANLAADLKNQSMGLMHTEFASSRLKGATFERAKLGSSDFEFADLRDVNFRDADLSGVDLTGADLRGADLTGASVSGAKFEGAKLDGAKGLKDLKNAGSATGLPKS